MHTSPCIVLLRLNVYPNHQINKIMTSKIVKIKKILIKIHWLLSSQFGIDPPRLMHAVYVLPYFLLDFWKFRKNYSGKLHLMPCLNDRHEEAGATKNEYFWQDLLVARWIHEAMPIKHVDIGSRVDGFVAHVASFREIEVIDVRPINNTIPGVIFQQANLMDSDFFLREEMESYCDSLSCLHVLEHFGLGRYGDPINPQGWQQGLKHMARLLKPGGTFYLSTPIGKSRVEFNANWVFNPKTVIHAAEEFKLKLTSLTSFTPMQGLQHIQIKEVELNRLSEQDYHLGIFIFIKQE